MKNFASGLLNFVLVLASIAIVVGVVFAFLTLWAWMLASILKWHYAPILLFAFVILALIGASLLDRKNRFTDAAEVFWLIVAALVAHPLGLFILTNFQLINVSAEDQAFFRDTMNLLQYSADQVAKGLLLDVLEGIRISLSDFLYWVFEVELVSYEVEPRSPIAVWDAIYRSVIAGMVLFFVGKGYNQLR